MKKLTQRSIIIATVILCYSGCCNIIITSDSCKIYAKVHSSSQIFYTLFNVVQHAIKNIQQNWKYYIIQKDRKSLQTNDVCMFCMACGKQKIKYNTKRCFTSDQPHNVNVLKNN